MQEKALKTIEQPSKKSEAEQNDLHGASAHTLTEPDQATAFEFDAAISSAVERKRSAPVKQIQTKEPLSSEMLDKMHRYWQAANYLTVGQIYLSENPLLREPLKPEHIKPRLLGHLGGPEFYLRAFESADRGARCGRYLYLGTGAWWPVHERALIPGRNLLRGPP